eukprot:2618582-Pyramimonas_sp.AAC.1
MHLTCSYQCHYAYARLVKHLQARPSCVAPWMTGVGPCDDEEAAHNIEEIRASQRANIKAGRPPDYAQTPRFRTDTSPTYIKDKPATNNRISPVEMPADDRRPCNTYHKL